MPKIYSTSERETLRTKLLQSGRELFAKQGFLKTSVGELAKAVGIAAGTFYNFFTSKEALFFEIMGEAELTKFEKIKEFFTNDGDPKEEFRSFLKDIYGNVVNDPIFNLVYEESLFERIVKKIPQEELLKHMKYDMDASKAILDSVQKRGVLLDVSPEELVSQLRALFMVTLHQEELGVEDMTAFMEQQIDIFIEGYFVIHEEAENDRG